MRCQCSQSAERVLRRPCDDRCESHVATRDATSTISTNRRKTWQPTGNASAIVYVLLTEYFAQVRLFIEMNEEHGAGGGNDEVEKYWQRPKVEGAGRDDREDAEVHGVPDVAIEAVDDEIFGGIDGRRRP